MAVQAQYPSNILLLNRNEDDLKNMFGGDYSMQGQTGAFINQSQTLFGNGVGGNPRKRGREDVAAAAASPINLFSLQPHPPQPSHPTIVNLAQLQNQQPAIVSTGLRLATEEQQQQQHQMGLLLPSSFLSSLSEDLSAQIKHQRDEIDQFLQAQGEQLRRTLAEKRRVHYRALLGAAEESAARMLREKETEVERATRRNAELEDRAAHLKAEAQVWQARARTQEATAASLQAQLQQAMMGAQDRREDLGCAGADNAPADDSESAYIDPGRVVSGSVPSCRVCRRRAVSVVLLPCRHLCLCTDCDMAVETCPLCHSVRSASVEVYLS